MLWNLLFIEFANCLYCHDLSQSPNIFCSIEPSLARSDPIRPYQEDVQESQLRFRAVGRSENPGVLVLFDGRNLPPLVEIGLTDLPKYGGAMSPLAPPGTTCLKMEWVAPPAHKAAPE